MVHTCATTSTNLSFYQRSRTLSIFSACILPLLFICLSVSRSVDAFTKPFRNNLVSVNMVQPQQHSSLLYSGKPNPTINSASASLPVNGEHQTSICELPGDPSLILTTNVDLGSTKIDVMKGKTY
jgi:hypothetical protein